MLRKIRRFFAALFFVGITLLFLDFTGTLHAWLGWMAKIQFLPAVLALNFGVVAALLVLTLLFGRVYCSVICPLGVFQDVVSHIAGKIRKNRFSYSPALCWMRYAVLVLFIVAMVAGVGSFVALLAPYSSYGRMVSNLLAPLYQWGNNIVAGFAERAGSYAAYETDVWVKSIPTFVIAALTFVVISWLAWRGGRTYCNTICPVGTVLGVVSRFSLFKVAFDEDKCKNCGLCARKCKASCIDVENHKIDHSRCVACMNCVSDCKFGALKLTHHRLWGSARRKAADAPVDTSRRTFLMAGAMAAGAATLKAQEMKGDGGLAAILDKKAPHRETKITPPGSWSAYNMAQRCTACQLCVSVCPNGVLRPSTDLMTLMQPEMSYERGYCRPECTKCSEVCPAGAIQRIDRAEKSSIQIGHAVWIRDNCVPLTDGVECGNCARHCPTGAIQMVSSVPGDALSVKIPVVDAERCIGCGACENLCPSRPFSAIYVEGHERHRTV